MVARVERQASAVHQLSHGHLIGFLRPPPLCSAVLEPYLQAKREHRLFMCASKENYK